MQRRDAIKSARACVVLSSDRWTKVLVRRQAHAFEIVAGMAQGGIGATRFQGRSQKRCDSEAWQSVRLASPGTEGLGYFRSAMARKGGNAIGVAPQGKVSKRRDCAFAPQAIVFGDSRRTLVFNQARSGNQQCERLQISISITRPLTLGIFRTRDSGIRSCADV